VSAEILTVGGTVSRFFETYLRHPKGARYGEPFVLEPWQRDFVDEFYRVDERGRRLYRIGLLGIPRGNGKTPLAAGLGLFELMTRPDAPDIFNAAGAKDQAKILTDFARSFVLGGELKTWLKASRRSIVHQRSNGVMRLLSSDGYLQHGLSVSAAFGDELHAWTSEAQEELWTAFVSALHKRDDSFALGITTAGFDRSTLLGRMYSDALSLEAEDRLVLEGVGPCLRIRRDLENGVLMWWYGPPDELAVDDMVENRAVWRAVNPASWVSVRVLEQQLVVPGFDEYDFARTHLNAWTETRETFIPHSSWMACRSKDAPRRGEPIYLAVDVGMTHDTTAVAWSQPLGRDRKVVNRVRVWSANPDHATDKAQRHVFVPGGRMDLDLVEDFILTLARPFPIKEIVYDPAMFEGTAQRLAKRGLPLAPMYQGGRHPQAAAQQFYMDVQEGRALHGGDFVLDRHVAAAAGLKTEHGWKIDRRNHHAPIDACVAVSWSHWRASRQAGFGASDSVYQDKELIVLDLDDGDEWD